MSILRPEERIVIYRTDQLSIEFTPSTPPEMGDGRQVTINDYRSGGISFRLRRVEDEIILSPAAVMREDLRQVGAQSFSITMSAALGLGLEFMVTGVVNRRLARAL